MSPNIMQCRQCNALFQSFGAEICPACAEKLDKDFTVIKNYLYDNPDANIMEIVRGTGIEEKTVLGFLREGRLAVGGSSGILRCEECGAPINSGRFCGRCQRILEGLFSAANRIKADRDAERNAAAGARPGKMHVDYRKRGLLRGEDK